MKYVYTLFICLLFIYFFVCLFVCVFENYYYYVYS